MSDGAALWAAQCAGCDLAMFGTRFIATEEAATPSEWQSAMESSTMDDVKLITTSNGVLASALENSSFSAGHTVSAVLRSEQLLKPKEMT